MNPRDLGDLGVIDLALQLPAARDWNLIWKAPVSEFEGRR